MNMKKKIRIEDKLDSAWYIAYNSMTHRVIGDENDDDEMLKQANYRLQQIDREEWFPEARLIIYERPYMDTHQLAEAAAEKFINKVMDTNHLKVYLGGDT